MATSVIVSYDGTTHDDDALALARMIAAGGAPLSLAYVRHTSEYDPRREEIAVFDADRRLEAGALWLEDPDIERHVVIDPSTGAGLARLAESEGAQLILFGSDYRTPPGRVEPGGAAQGLLERRPGGHRCRPGRPTDERPGSIKTISVAGEPGGAAEQTARIAGRRSQSRDHRGRR